jgi:hypothetical protein
LRLRQPAIFQRQRQARDPGRPARRQLHQGAAFGAVIASPRGDVRRLHGLAEPLLQPGAQRIDAPPDSGLPQPAGGLRPGHRGRQAQLGGGPGKQGTAGAKQLGVIAAARRRTVGIDAVGAERNATGSRRHDRGGGHDLILQAALEHRPGLNKNAVAGQILDLDRMIFDLVNLDRALAHGLIERQQRPSAGPAALDRVDGEVAVHDRIGNGEREGRGRIERARQSKQQQATGKNETGSGLHGRSSRHRRWSKCRSKSWRSVKLHQPHRARGLWRLARRPAEQFRMSPNENPSPPR